ncbi:putative mitochondrial N5-glutamine methyltransferase [Nadsonia fulvescens var. elongata DSM 6958]|uniref:Putative mitochondrial N5-glutamine methyltransferase n=1 Tax=Nadsonia fulvescens var. elongata DSM 6958 TaxID=857566 RepID=A0A1E3PNE1_9ASCO|nr:putative mitochondrial N5-glutamine methyltransferase [Nadsonia fulvescens var. elongata DSM 6958]
MTRISPRLSRKARLVDVLLPYLLPTLRTIPDAQQELKWIRRELTESETNSKLDSCTKNTIIRNACKARGKGLPLQYILGTQPFGTLEILCRKSVLIPRWETEEWTEKILGIIKKQLIQDANHSSLRILDLCTGTGCIPLYLSTGLHNSQIYGADIHPTAVKLSQKNLLHNREILKNNNNDIRFFQTDIFDDNQVKSLISSFGSQSLDLITFNPPYISKQNLFSTNTEPSVRRYEPKLALLGGMEFYLQILHIALMSGAKAVICEVGDLDQINQTRALVRKLDGWDSGEYRDYSGNPRAVAFWKRGTNWELLNDMCSKS